MSVAGISERSFADAQDDKEHKPQDDKGHKPSG